MSCSSDSSAKFAAPRRTCGQVGDRPVVHGGHRHELLRGHVERVAGVAGGLDAAVQHPLDDDGRLEEVGPVLREDLAPARLAHLVAGPADPLQAPGDRPGRLDLHDEVDGPHVDAQLEGGGRHQAPQRAPLQLVLDEEAPLPRERPVMGLDQLVALLRRGGADGLARRRRQRAPGVAGAVAGASRLLRGPQLVEAGGETLGQAAGVDEDDRGAVLAHQVDQAGVHRWPDRAAGRAGGRAGRRLVGQWRAHRAEVLGRARRPRARAPWYCPRRRS